MELKELNSEFSWARGLTLDLLRSCDESDLLFELNSSCGTLWKQFRHIGRVHENYLGAIETGSIEFGFKDCSYHEGPSCESLLKYFSHLEARHTELLTDNAPNHAINWFGETSTLSVHLARLLSHEALHHGQLILYWRSLGKTFPKSWEAWGE